MFATVQGGFLFPPLDIIFYGFYKSILDQILVYLKLESSLIHPDQYLKVSKSHTVMTPLLLEIPKVYGDSALHDFLFLMIGSHTLCLRYNS